MNLIVAVDENWAIGNRNKLLVSIPADMKFFREMTKGNVVVMGRKTMESFPGGQPLKKRTNIVLSRDESYQVKDAVVVHSLEELLEQLKSFSGGIHLCHRRGEHLPDAASILQGGVYHKDPSQLCGGYLFPGFGCGSRMGAGR